MLPKNSRVKKGKVWPAEKATANGKKPKRTKEFKVYRYNPDERHNPTRSISIPSIWTAAGPMVLDALIKIKNEIDPTYGIPPVVPRGRVRFLRHEHRQPGGALARARAAINEIVPAR